MFGTGCALATPMLAKHLSSSITPAIHKVLETASLNEETLGICGGFATGEVWVKVGLYIERCAGKRPAL